MNREWLMPAQKCAVRFGARLKLSFTELMMLCVHWLQQDRIANGDVNAPTTDEQLETSS
jgi:hypothetical protein